MSGKRPRCFSRKKGCPPTVRRFRLLSARPCPAARVTAAPSRPSIETLMPPSPALLLPSSQHSKEHGRRLLRCGRSHSFADGRASGSGDAVRRHLGGAGGEHQFAAALLLLEVLADEHEVDLAVAGPRERQVKALGPRSEEQTSELQSLMRNSYADLRLKKKK